MTIETGFMERTQVYQVRMSCGHIEQRRMRPATAGMPWSPTAVVQAGAKCACCRDIRSAVLRTPKGQQASFFFGEK